VRLGISSWSYHRSITSGKMDIEDFIRRAFELGVDGVELNQRFFEPNRNRLKGIKRLLLLYGLDISCVTIANNFCLPREEERKRQVALVKEWVDAALLLGAPIVRVNAGWARELDEEAAFNYAVECIREICRYAEDYGLMIAVENHGGITSTAEQVLRLIEAVDSDWFRVNLDTANFKQDLYGSIEKLAPYTVHVHAKVFELKLKQSGVGSCWIEAKLDYERILRILKEVGYNGYLSLEYEGGEEEEIAVPKSIQFLKDMIAYLK